MAKEYVNNKTIMFFGFSVTEDSAGYTKRLKSNHNLVSVGIGGIQPNHAKYLVDKLLRNHQPDIVAFEISTAPFRKWTSREKYTESLLCLLSSAVQHNALPVLIDLPRRDTYGVDDWVEAINSKVATQIRVPHFSFATASVERSIAINEIFRDEVHTTALGAEIYSELIAGSIEEWVDAKNRRFDPEEVQSHLGTANFASSVDLFEALKSPDSKTIEFSRGGYRCTATALQPGHPIYLDELRRYGEVSGFSYIMGPRSGRINCTFDDDNQSKTINCYDQFCYYRRYGAIEFEPRTCDRLKIEQTADIPETKLVKGSPDTGSRSGELVQIFFSNSNQRLKNRDSKIFTSLQTQ